MSQSYDKFFKDARKAKKTGTTKRSVAGASRATVKPTLRSTVKKATPQLTAEDVLRRKLKIKQSRKPRQETPWSLVMALFVGALLLGWGLYDPSGIEDIVKRVEIDFMGSANAASGEEKTSGTKGAKKAKSSLVTDSKDDIKEIAKQSWTEEDISNFSKLGRRQFELDQREEELNKLEEELHKQKLEVEARIKKLEKIRTEISVVLKDKVDIDQKKVDKLVAFYSNMKPAKAAIVLAVIDENLAVDVIGKMKKKNAAEIMNLLKKDKARRISEKFAGYMRRTPASR